MIVNNDANAVVSHQAWGGAIYVRDFMASDQLVPLALLKLVAIMHENYGLFDLVALALEAHDRKTESGVQPAYIKHLVTPKA